MFCSDSKQPFATAPQQSAGMPEKHDKSVNEVLADNLRYWMQEAGLTTQGLLAAKSGVAQRTISNYLNPQIRQESTTGKEPSAKLTELGKIADALGVGVWDLVRPMSPKERAFYRQVESAYSALVNDPIPGKGDKADPKPRATPVVQHIGPPSKRSASTGPGLKNARSGHAKRKSA